MQTLLVVATLVVATLPLGQVKYAPAVMAAHEVMLVGGPSEPIPLPFPR